MTASRTANYCRRVGVGALLVVLADFLFYGQPVGITVFLFGIVLNTRPGKVGKAYELIWNKEKNESFLRTYTRSQAELLFQELWRANDDSLPIALHHGSLDVGQRRRVEKAMELAGWVLGMSEGEISRLQRSGDRTDRRAPPVRVVTTYFTAWPDASGVVQYYDDIYRKDRQVGRCAGDGITTSRSEASAPTYEEYEVE